MTVYVLAAVYYYEGEAVLGAYATKAAAMAAAEPARVKYNADETAVYAIEVDAEPVLRSDGRVLR